VAPFSLGVSSAKKLGQHTVTGLFSPILERGTVVPASRVQVFTTLEDNQEAIQFTVYQGEHSLVADNQKLGEYKIELEPLPAGEHDVAVRFTYDLNGILEVDITPLRTGKTETLVIEGAPGRLSPQQIEEARRAMQRLKFHPREALPNATLLARAEALYAELTGNARAELGHAMAAFRLGLETQDDATISPHRDRLALLVNQYRR
jgi:molecular chaperone HscC